MDKNGKIDLGQLTHLLVRGLGWIPVDDGKTERMISENPRFVGSGDEYEVIVFKAEGKTIAVDAAIIDGWKFK